LRAITDNGCFADAAKDISLNPLPKVKFGYNGFLCPLSTIQFTDSSVITTAGKSANGNGVLVMAHHQPSKAPQNSIMRGQLHSKAYSL